MKFRHLAAAIFAMVLLILVNASSFAHAAPTDNPPYGSIAYSMSLDRSFFSFGDSKESAEDSAFNACLQYANQHPDQYKKDCNSAVWVHNGYMSIAVDTAWPDPQTKPWGTGWGPTKASAEQWAVNSCENEGGKSCDATTMWTALDPQQQTEGGPGFGMGKSNFPAPGVYRGAGVFYTDSTGLQLSWATSDVYTYTDVPRDWRVDIYYRNVGTQNIALTCDGWTDPSNVSEDMEGTGNSGIVHASQTFCSTHPGWRMTLAPDALFSSDATFHNVPWEGGTVSIIWGSFGRTPAIDPWKDREG